MGSLVLMWDTCRVAFSLLRSQQGLRSPSYGCVVIAPEVTNFAVLVGGDFTLASELPLTLPDMVAGE